MLAADEKQTALQTIQAVVTAIAQNHYAAIPTLLSQVQRGGHGQAAVVPRLRAAVLDGHTLRRAPGAHAVRLHAG